MRPMLLIALFALLTASVAVAEDRDPPRPPAVDQPSPPAEARTTVELDETTATDTIDPEATAAMPDPGQRPAMMAELRTIREDERDAVNELVAELASASPTARLELQREIAAVKADATLASLNIQQQYAEAGGHTELARRLSAEIELFEARREAPRGAIVTDSARDRSAARGGESR